MPAKIPPEAFLALRWQGQSLSILDQTRLPQEEVYLELHSPQEVAEAICTMKLRGAPLLGVAAAFGMALAAKRACPAEMAGKLQQTMDLLVATRPTANSINWASARMMRCAENAPPGEIAERLEKEALAIQQEDYEACRAIGEYGASLLPQCAAVLTHCNAGALATAGWGTALGIVRSAIAQGKQISVFADETRPLLQGSRLTAWELARENIPVTIIADGAAGYCMRQGMVQAVIVGADRIAGNGDVANKVGTYLLAVAANDNNIPFYVAAPVSAYDSFRGRGKEIPIEERAAEELLSCYGRPVAAEPAGVFNPAFDITPARLITAVICEKGIISPPFAESWPRFAESRPR
jgi:methylthioribose-1-phosphate isomerase